MSQSQGGLTEDELKDYINSRYGLRLERDAFLKPQRDVIIEIYQKFLDEFWPPWRRSSAWDREEAPPVKALMIRHLRNIIKIYNNTHVIHLTDLISPTRQRTRITMSLLIYHRERLQEIINEWEEIKDSLLGEQEEYEKKEKELAEGKERIEQLAIMLSTSESIDNLKLSIVEKERILEETKARCDAIASEAKDLKTKNLIEREKFEKKKIHGEELKQEREKLEETLEILNNGLHIERRIADTERNITEEEEQLNQIRSKIMKDKKVEAELEKLLAAQRLFDKEAAPYLDTMVARCIEFQKDCTSRRVAKERLQNSILENQKREESMLKKRASLESKLQDLELETTTELDKAKMGHTERLSQLRDRMNLHIKEGEHLIKETEEANKSRIDLKAKTKQALDQHKEYMDRADRKMRLFEETYMKSKEQTEKTRTIVYERPAKINELLGIIETTAEMTMMEQPANRTYIKDTGTNGR